MNKKVNDGFRWNSMDDLIDSANLRAHEEKLTRENEVKKNAIDKIIEGVFELRSIGITTEQIMEVLRSHL